MFPDIYDYFNNTGSNPRKSVDFGIPRKSVDFGFPRKSIDLGRKSSDFTRRSVDFGRRKSSFALYQPDTPSGFLPQLSLENFAELPPPPEQRLPTPVIPDLSPAQRRHSSITAYLLAYDKMVNNPENTNSSANNAPTNSTAEEGNESLSDDVRPYIHIAHSTYRTVILRTLRMPTKVSLLPRSTNSQCLCRPRT